MLFTLRHYVQLAQIQLCVTVEKKNFITSVGRIYEKPLFICFVENTFVFNKARNILT